MAVTPNSGAATAGQWIDRWKTQPLAILMDTAARLQRLREQTPEPSAGQIASIVQIDPFLAFLVLKAVSGRQRGGLAAEVISIEAALRLLGCESFFQRFGQLPLIEQRLAPNSASYVRLIDQIMQARQAARFAYDFAVARLDMRPDEIYVAALLDNLASCHLALHAPEVASNWGHWHHNTWQDDVEWQRARLGASLMDVRQRLLQLAGLSDGLQSLLAPDDEPNARYETVRLAVALARLSVSGWSSAAMQPMLDELAGLLRKDRDWVWARVRRSAVDHAREWSHSAICAPAACWLPLLPGDWPQPTPARAQFVLASSTQKPVADDGPPLQPVRDRILTADSSNRVLGAVIQGLISVTQVRRVVLALLSTDGGRLVARHVQGAASDDPIRQFSFALKPANLLSRLLEKPSGIWLNSLNEAQLRPHLPDGWGACVGQGEWFAMSLFVERTPIGLLLADQASKVPMTDIQYQQFKQLCQFANSRLAQLAPAGS